MNDGGSILQLICVATILRSPEKARIYHIKFIKPCSFVGCPADGVLLQINIIFALSELTLKNVLHF